MKGLQVVVVLEAISSAAEIDKRTAQLTVRMHAVKMFTLAK